MSSKGYIFIGYFKGARTKNEIRQPKGKESNVLIVRDFISLFMVVFNVGVEVRMVKREIRFYFVFESKVKSLPGWSKTINSSNIENSRSDHPTRQMKSIGRRLPKTNSSYKHVRLQKNQFN